jgi:hypothetical protein
MFAFDRGVATSYDKEIISQPTLATTIFFWFRAFWPRGAARGYTWIGTLWHVCGTVSS